MTEATKQAVPLTILTGFLGAGKTTLLNYILTGDHGLKVGILVNDFGSINVDAELVVDVEDGMISLANGCICCEIRDDLIESVAELLEREDPIEYIILEASGVAEPSSIYMTFVDSSYRDMIRLDSVTCVVDTDQVFDNEDPELYKLKLEQIGFADLVIMNKVDLAGVETAAEVKRWIDEHFKRVRIVPAVNCQVPLEILLSVGRFDVSRLDHAAKHHHGHEHAHDHTHRSIFKTWNHTWDQPFSRRSLERMVKRELPANVYRCKGFVHIADDPGNRYVLQVVGRRVELARDRSWGGDTPLTRLVAIAHGASLDGDHLTELFDTCVAAMAEDTNRAIAVGQ